MAEHRPLDRDPPAPSIHAPGGSVRQRPADPERWASHLKMLVSADRWQDVLDSLEQFRQAAPDLADSRDLLLLKVRGLIGLTHYPEALEALDRMAEFGFDGGLERFWRGTALNELGRHSEALTSLELAATRLEPAMSTNALFVQRLIALNGVGRPEDALDVARQAEASWRAEDPKGPLLLQKAIALKQTNHLREALETIDQARKSWPDGIPTEWLLYQTAEVLNALKEPERALATLDQLEALSDRRLPSGTLAFQRGVAQFQLGHLKQSIESFARVRDVPADLEGLAAALMGGALFELGRFDEAEAPLTRAVDLAERLQPATAGATAYRLGIVEFRAGRLEQAVPRLEMAVRLAPDLTAASNDLVFVLLRLGRVDEARRANDAALARASDASVRAQARLWRARIEAYEGHAREALDALQAAARDDPQVQQAPDTVTMEAGLLLQLGELDRAMGVLDQAAIDTPVASALIGIMRGTVLLLRGQAGDLDAALRAFAQVTELPDPSAADESLRLLKAVAYLNQGDARRAARLLDEVTDPNVKMTGDYWGTRAMSLFMVDRADEALEAANRALDILGPHAYPVRLARASALTSLGQEQEAIDEFDRALIDAPKFAPLHIGKGFALIKQERFTEALAAFRTAKEEATDGINRVVAAVGEGLALDLSGEHERALRVLKENAPASDTLPARVPYRGLAWWTLGTFYAKQERDEEALDAFVRASGLEPDNARIQIDQGCIHARLEDFGAALRCFQAAGRTVEEEEKTRALIGQGGALAKLDRYDEAVAAYRAALGLEPESATAWQALAEAYAADRRHSAALQAFRRAYRLSQPEPGGRRPSGAALGVSAQLLALEKNQDAWQFLDNARHELESDPKLDFNRGIALTRLRRYREAIKAFRAASDEPGAADQVEALEARRSRGRSWLDVWFGADASPPLRIGGAAILVSMALLMGLMLLNPKQVPALAWVNTADAWKAMGVLVLILLLPSVGRLKWGEVEVQSLPQEALPEIHLSPSEPRSALEVLIRSARPTPSLLGPAGIPAHSEARGARGDRPSPSPT